MARITNIRDVYDSIDTALFEIKWVEKSIIDAEGDVDLSDISSTVDDVKDAIENIKSKLDDFNCDLETKMKSIKVFFEEVLD